MNNIITIIEIILVVAIIFLQLKYGLETKKSILKLKTFLPKINQLDIDKLIISTDELSKKNPKEIIDRFDELKDIENQCNEEIYLNAELYLFHQDNTELNLIAPTKSFNTSFDTIKESLNIYLIKNKGSVADFNLIKDVIERNIDAEDDMIAQSINTPLYLGLMGTMLGIIFGLFNLYIIQGSGQDIFDQGISSFLISVAIAMIASLFGLAFTVYNSVLGFKDARRIIETNKNELYTLIQTELMPLINQSVSASVSTLKDVLIKFNTDFGSNLGKLDKMFAKNYQTISAQATILSSLESIDINNFAKANVKVLKELKETVPNLEKFNAALNSSDRLINNTENLSKEINQILQRTNDFSLIAKGIDQRIEETRTVMEYLKTHISKFESSDDLLMKWVMKADDSMARTVTEYQKLIDTQKEGIKQMTMKETELLEKAFEENRSYFANLKYLENLKDSNNELADKSNTIVEIKSELEALKIFFDRTNTTLEKGNELVKESKKTLEKTSAVIEKSAHAVESIPNRIKVDVISDIFKNPFKKKKING